MPRTLTELPQFELTDFLTHTSYGSPGFSGRFDRTEGVREIVCWLRISGEKHSKGSLHAFDARSHTATFLPWEGREYLSIGMKLPWIDAFWKPTDIEMVIDPAWSWTQTRFELRDGWRIDADIEGAIMAKAPEPEVPVPEGVTLISKGWDHEHCHFCWQKIGTGGAASGFIDSAGTWLCENCYSSFVVTHDLSFMAIFGRIWPEATSALPGEGA
jgi:hypothetical protein